MKKVIYPVEDGGAPIVNEILIGLIQEQNFLQAEAMLQGMTGGRPCVITGCVGSDGGSGTTNISEGYVWLDGRVRKFNGATALSTPCWLKSGANTITSASSETGSSFFDTSDPDYVVEHTVTAVNSDPGDIDKIKYSPMTYQELFPTWHLIGQTGEPAFENSFGNMGGGDVTKFRKWLNGDLDIILTCAKTGFVGGGVDVFILPEDACPEWSSIHPIICTIPDVRLGRLNVNNAGSGGNISVELYDETGVPMSIGFAYVRVRIPG